ncbi:cupin domain-containing protein [Alteribacillus bidgolensis]|uniref:Transcriptional regulator, XRE family with cupin sensor n=1 Tax=Alteribacillus bidgolensis TaxID=930129 RepID=A0A1G8RGY4_9BACI|nr:cupin domain-containing protein [Alteribacillus bidgolensis]SDJ16228.1 transcriptional regulator, XRE family with cupin sensor [Alteribacillus bidgolensis]
MSDINETNTVGEKLRTIRLSKGVTLNMIASQTGLTSSFISQFERGLTTASIASMQKIVQVLDIPLASLFDKEMVEDDTADNVSIVRKDNRRQLSFPKPALTNDYLLTNLDGKLQVIYSTIEPGGKSGEPYSHNSDEECIIILSGVMEITINNKTYELHEGDTIKFTSRSPHDWKNTGENTLEALWIITPPSF